MPRLVSDPMRTYCDRRAGEYDDWWFGGGRFTDRDRPGWRAEADTLTRLFARVRIREEHGGIRADRGELRVEYAFRSAYRMNRGRITLDAGRHSQLSTDPGLVTKTSLECRRQRGGGR